MSKRKLQKTKTNVSFTKSLGSLARNHRRAIFVAGLVLVVVPASWLTVQAYVLPGGGPGSLRAPAGDAAAGSLSVQGSSTGAAGDERNNKSKESAKLAADAKRSQAGQPPKIAGTGQAGALAGAGGVSPGNYGSPAAAVSAPPPAPAGLHTNIITTIFWAGETADASNAYISNVPSAWDEKWEQHYGGYDNPNSRNGYAPAGFTPLENPFYFALPYNDYDSNGQRKASAGHCSAVTGVTSAGTSWCKNAWIQISKGGKTAYAQWQDVGPLQEDDVDYVFGSAPSKNTWGAKAGLDVSPAVRDYLGLQGIDTTSWAFVSAGSVPAGPWKNTVTTSGVYWE